MQKTLDNYLYIVSNAGCRQKDIDLLDRQLSEFRAKGKDVAVEYLEQRALVALQGPQAAAALQPLVDYDLNTQPFMTTRLSTLCGVSQCRVTRCGYTGEDGFEISIASDRAEHVLDNLLADTRVKLAGLGARDTLRLEAGLCLYGNDIDETITPVEAGLVWTIGKRRREQCDFPGAVKILQQIRDKPTRKRVGMRAALDNSPPPRQGYQVRSSDKTKSLGRVSSGCRSPSLQANICMAYVDASVSKIGSRVALEVRNKLYDYEVVKMPFVPSKYFVAKR